MNNNDCKDLVFETKNNNEKIIKVFKIEARHSGLYLNVRNGENPQGKLDGQEIIQSIVYLTNLRNAIHLF